MKYDMNNCPSKPLPQVLTTIVDNRGKSAPTADKGHILIATNCIRNENLYPVYERIRYVSDDVYHTWFRAHPEPGDIIFVNKGTPGRVCMVPDPVDFCIAQDMMAFRVNPEIVYNKYLLAILRSRKVQATIMNSRVGTMIPHFKKEHLKLIEVPLPDMEIQRKIGDFYFELSEKIELNKKINQNIIDQTVSYYQNEFPFTVDDELPEGWTNGCVGDIVEIHDKQRRPLSGNVREAMKNKKYPYYGAASLMDYVDDYIFDGKYLLLGEDGTVVDNLGYPVLQYVWGKFWCNNHAHILTGKRGFNVESLLLFFKNTPVKSIVTGAVQAKISQGNLRSIPIAIPPIEIITKFNAEIEPYFDLYRLNEEQNAVLADTRDTILPQLLSGNLDVSSLDI